MKTKDIKIGEHYLAGYCQRVEVLNTGILKSGWRGSTPMRNGVEVKMLDNDGSELLDSDGKPQIDTRYTSRDIQMTWQDHLAKLETQKAAKDLRAAQLAQAKEQADILKAELTRLGISTDRISIPGWQPLEQPLVAHFTLKVEDLDRLAEALSVGTTGTPQKAAQAAPQAASSASLADLLAD